MALKVIPFLVVAFLLGRKWEQITFVRNWTTPLEKELRAL